MTFEWRDAARLFFDERAGLHAGQITLAELSYVSGRDARLWAEAEMYEDLISSILQQSGATTSSNLLEVGSASGFLAWGLAPQLSRYVGVDVAAKAIQLARKLNLPNAEFKAADGTKLQFPDSSFDAAICYDVFTNFPSFESGAKIIEEMVRVVRPGGRVLLGSIPDYEHKVAFEEKTRQVSEALSERYGPPRALEPAAKLGMLARLKRALSTKTNVTPGISCYYFHREDFLNFGRHLGVPVEICDIHPRNPYYGLRFNAVFYKPAK